MADAAEMTSTDLAPVAGVPVVAGKLLTPALFATKEAVDSVLQAIEAECARFKETRDISTPAGRAAIASFAYKIARSKTALDGMGKNVVDDWKTKASAVDAERRRIRERCDELKEDVRKPLDAWEEAEAARVAEHEKAILDVQALLDFVSQEPTAAQIKTRIDILAARPAREWQEFVQRACDAVMSVSRQLEDMHKAAVKREAEAAELERLRAENIERELRERDEKIAAEAAERARLEAEAKAKREAEEAAERAAVEQRRVERERQEAIERAERAEQDHLAAIAQAEEDKRLAAEAAAQAERDRIAAEERAEAERQAAAKREEQLRAESIEREERAREEAAAQAKREQEEAERQAAIEAERREQDTRIRARVNNAAADALVEHAKVDAEVAKAVVIAIARNLIPNVRITY